MLSLMMGIKMIETIGTDEIRARAGPGNVGESIREARLTGLGHVEGRTEEDVATRTWKIEVSGH